MDEKSKELSEEWRSFSQARKLLLIEEGLLSLPGPRPRLKKVIIVGAGMAGLVAAFELKRTGLFDVRILEARQSVGGRIRTIREPYLTDGLYGEAGAMRIPKTHKLTVAYIDRANKDERQRQTPLECFRFSNDDPMAWCFFNGIAMRWKDYKTQAEAGMDCFSFGLTKEKDYVKKTISERFDTEVIEPLRETLRARMSQGKNDEPTLAELLHQWRGSSTNQFLLAQGWSDRAINVFGLFENQQARLNNGVVALLREHLAGSFSESNEKDKYTQIYGGMDLLPKSFFPYLEKNILFGARVYALEKDRENARVHYATIGGEKKTGERYGEEAHYAIITLPFPILRHVDLRPTEGQFQWDRSKINAIQDLNYSESGKILFQCSKRFWEDEEIKGGRSQTDLAIRTVYYPTKHPDPDKQTQKAILLASYTWGRDSQRWTHLSHTDRIQQAFKELTIIHPRLKGDPDLIEGAYSIMWQNDEFSGGAFALTNPYQETHDEPCRSIDGRFHFAGEHTSLNYHRWIEGAVESGLRSAWEVYKVASTEG